MALLLDAIKQFCVEQGNNHTYWIAYSGGLDSTVLLDLFVKAREIHPIQLHAIYINHSLSPNAKSWGSHCQKMCAEYQVSYIQKTINAKSTLKESPEEIAREKRYEVFLQLLSPKDFLITAHHQDDQAETLLLQMLRGAGPKGLAAMPVLKPFGKGFHARPLLNFTRDDLKKYAEENHLQWIDDESNDNTHFSRNYIRHEVMPIFKKRWPSVTKTLSRVAAHCAEAQSLLDEYAEKNLTDCMGSKPNTLSVKKLLSLSSAECKQVLRAWLQQLNFSIPSLIKLQEIEKNVLTARRDKQPKVDWGNVEVRRYRDDIYAMNALLEYDATQVFAWDLKNPLEIPSLGVLQATEKMGAGLRRDIHSVTIQFRHGGESCQLPNRDCHHKLKKLFQTWGIPPWERSRVPLVFFENKLIGAVGYFIDEECNFVILKL